MKISTNLLPTLFESKISIFTNSDDEKIKSFSTKTSESGLKININTTHLDPKVKEKKDNNAFDSSLIEGSAYEKVFKKEELNFSNMSIKELHSIVKNVNEMEREYTQKYDSDEPVRLGKSGNPIISKKREDMNSLESKLRILSYGGGDVDPDKKINVMEYFSNSSEKLDGLAKEYPERQTYQVRASYMKEIINTFDKFISDDTFDLYQEKAALLLTDKKKVDVFIWKKPRT